MGPLGVKPSSDGLQQSIETCGALETSLDGALPFQTRRAELQLSILALNLIYAALGVVLMYLSYRLIDRLTPEVDFPAELKRGNIAVAIFIAALFVSIALIVGRAIG
jgi:uncharacterized membrane protein YjfL (UPF0719 family)